MNTPLDPARVARYLVEQEAKIDAQREMVERLYELHDQEWRRLGDMEGRFAEQKRILAERGELP